MSTLERVTLDDLRYPARPERIPIWERWGQVSDYADSLERAGKISSETKRRVLRTVGRWLILELLAGKLEGSTQAFDRKVYKRLLRITGKMK